MFRHVSGFQALAVAHRQCLAATEQEIQLAIRQRSVEGMKRFASDFSIIQIGFLLFGISINILVQASLGLDSWDVLQMALTYHLPLTLGESNIIVAFLVILVDIALKEPLGWGTIANMIFIGLWVDFMKPYVPSVPHLFPIQVAYLLLGTIIMGFATAIYIGVDLRERDHGIL